MLYQLQIHSKMIQLYIYVYPFFFRFFPHIGYCRKLYVLLCNFLKFNIMYVRFIPADGRNCCDNIFIAVHRCSSIFHPQTFGLFACFYYHKAGMNILKHMCRSISMPQSGVAGLGVHTSSTSTDSKLCPKWLQQLACLPANS